MFFIKKFILKLFYFRKNKLFVKGSSNNYISKDNILVKSSFKTEPISERNILVKCDFRSQENKK